MKRVEVVAAVIFNAARTEVLVALRKPSQHQGDRWEFPGGKLESGESIAVDWLVSYWKKLESRL